MSAVIDNLRNLSAKLIEDGFDLNGGAVCVQAVYEIERLRAENEALKRDAERYRWLRNEKNDVAMVIDKRTGYIPPDDAVPYVGGHYTYEYRANAELDEAIDRAMKG